MAGKPVRIAVSFMFVPNELIVATMTIFTEEDMQ